MKIFLKSVLILAAVLKFATRAEDTAEIIYVRVGDTATLKPPAGVDLKKYYQYWYFGHENGPLLCWRNPHGGQGFYDPKKEKEEADHWSNKLSLSDNSLIIKDVQQENFGRVVHTVSEGSGKSLSRTIFQLLKLTVTVAPTSVCVPGESLTLTCAIENSQRAEIHWLNPQREKFHRGTIEKLATVQDNGDWTCVVTNNKKESKVIIPVTVVDFSPAPAHPQCYTSESSPLTIPFSIPAGISWDQVKSVGVKEVNLTFYPKLASHLTPKTPQRLFYLSLNDSMTWKEDQGRKLRPVFNQKNAFSLTRKLGKDDDRGEYVCSMTARKGKTLKTTVRVEVLQITASPGAELISGQQVNLTCSLGEPLPSDLTLNWIPPQQSSLQKPNHHAKITILEVGARDEGVWRCELLRGDTCLTSAEITLKIESKLSVWMLVITCSVTVIVLLILLLVFILCRRRHRKTSRRHRLCKCKNPKPKGFYRT